MTNGKPRRRSIFSGLLLITVGTLLLMQRFGWWHYDLWRVIGQWWPVLLIIWGLAKLYDHVMAQRTGEDRPRTISGGEIFLVFLVLIILGGAGFRDYFDKHPGDIDWGPGDWNPWVGQSYKFNEEIPAKAVPANSRITIQTDRGDITIHPENTAEIRVSVRKSISGSNQEDAESRGKQINVSIQQTADGYTVQTQGMERSRTRVDLEVHVPKQASVTLRSERGNLLVIGMGGSVTAETRSGDVEVRDTGGDVSADLTRGDAHIIGVGGNAKLTGRGSQVTLSEVKGEASIEGEFFGPIRIEKAGKGARFQSKRTDLTISQLSGRFSINSGRLEIVDAPGSVSLTTSSNDISLENVAGRIHVENRNGNVEVHLTQPLKDQIEISDSNGNLDLVLSSNSTFEIHANTRSGDISSDFTELSKDVHESGASNSLDGKVGAKGPMITLKTTYGAIRLRKRD